MVTRVLATCLILLTVLFLAGEAEAIISGACAPDAPGQCQKSLTLSAGNTVLTIVLSNTSPVANSGFITADAFDLPGAVTPTLTSKTDPDFFLFVGPISTSGGEVGGGSREFSIALDANWEGGGNPNPGIPAGGTATFVFGLSGAVGGLTESAIFTSEAIRFRGFADGGSDKDLVTPGTVIPEPTTLLLVGSGLVGLAHVARRRKNR